MITKFIDGMTSGLKRNTSSGFWSNVADDLRDEIFVEIESQRNETYRAFITANG